MDFERLASLIDRQWRTEIVPRLVEYIRIPNLSPAFDADWAAHGHMDRALTLAAEWCRAQPVPGLVVEEVHLSGRTPLLFLEIPGTGPGTVLLYGHLDKQPEMSGWRDGLGPFHPVLDGDKLYGRGGADDGYAVFAALTAVRGALECGGAIPRCVVLVVCLDSGCGNYDQLWLTTSLRGLVNGVLTVEMLTEGVHSGDASGIVPSTFRIARLLLSRLEDETTGRVRPIDLHAEPPAARREQAAAAAEALGEAVHRKYPFVPGAGPTSRDPAELVLAQTWAPALSVVGASGLPPAALAGNVLRPTTSLKLSLRLPPTLDSEAASRKVKRLLEADPPYGAHVRFDLEAPADGWNAPDLGPRLTEVVDEASRRWFGAPAVSRGEGGSIPFMAMLGRRFPDAKFVVTGVLGPGSNAHGPNEFLHLPTARRLTCCVAEVLHSQATSSR